MTTEKSSEETSAPFATFRIDRGADLADMFGGQTDFEVAVYMTVHNPDGTKEPMDMIGAGHTIAEAITEARDQLRAWRAIRHPLGMASRRSWS